MLTMQHAAHQNLFEALEACRSTQFMNSNVHMHNWRMKSTCLPFACTPLEQSKYYSASSQCGLEVGMITTYFICRVLRHHEWPRRACHGSAPDSMSTEQEHRACAGP